MLVILALLAFVGPCLTDLYFARPVQDDQALLPKVVCYFSGWAVRRPGLGRFTVDNIDPNSCTHYIYAFAGLDPFTYTITSLDEDIDIRQGGYKKFVGLKRLNSNAKVMLAVGGWTEGGEKYSIMARDPRKRAAFVQSVVEYLEKHQFDGLDVDWEYPGALDRDGIPQDKRNFVELIKELKSAFYSRGYLLSAAVTPNKYRVDDGYNVPELNRYLDFINVMTYDMHGFWEGFVEHHSRLYPRPQDEGNLTINNADYGMRYWLRSGADRRKLIMGIPFYGRSFTLVTRAVDSTKQDLLQGGHAANYTQEPGFIAYYEVCPNIQDSSWTRGRDEFGAVPYMNKNDQWIGYDDVDSIAVKSRYIQRFQYGGAMVWAIDLDDFQGICGTKYPLIRKINEILRGHRSPPPHKRPPGSSGPSNAHQGIPPNQVSDPSISLFGRYPSVRPVNYPLAFQGHTGMQGFPMISVRLPYFTVAGGSIPYPFSTIFQPQQDFRLQPIRPVLYDSVKLPEVRSQSLTSMPLCAEEESVYGDPSECSSFYLCSRGFFYHMSCPESLIYDEDSTTCTRADRVICHQYDASLKAGRFKCPGDGMFQDPEDCSKFYWCHGNQVNHIACAPGTYFDPDHLVCAHRHERSCESSGPQPGPEPGPESSPAPETSTTPRPTQAPTSRLTTTSRPPSATQKPTTTQVPAIQTTTNQPTTRPPAGPTSTPKLPQPTPSRQPWETPKPHPQKPISAEGLTDDYKMVCYFTNWAWYRPDIGKFYPEDTDVALCTHVIYAFSVLNGESLLLRPHDSWADLDNDFFRRVVNLKKIKPSLKVLLGLGGWTDSAGDKYSRLVNNPNARRRFNDHVIQFINEYGFDGLDLDWEYPKCWQVDCNKGPASDKEGFAAWVRELREAFDREEPRLLLTAAVSPSKNVIDLAYDVPTLGRDLDFINVMTYDYHGSWEKQTGHVAPLYFYPGDQFETFNSNYTIHYWMEKGAPRHKLIMGVPMYGQSWTLAGNSDKKDLNAPASGPGEAGPYSRQGGMLSYYEICHKLRNDKWTVVRDPHGRIGPYAYKGHQWFSYDDVDQVRRKAEYIKSMNLGGGMIWALDFDDFRNRCCTEEHPLLRTLNRVLRNYPSESSSQSLPCLQYDIHPDPQYDDLFKETGGPTPGINRLGLLCQTSRCVDNSTWTHLFI